jgi:hypothetical protein
MNRIAGLVLAGLVLLLLGVTLTQSQPAQAVSCPAGGGSPSTACDASGNCFHHCCLSSGLCPSSSCVSSLDAPSDARSLCSNKCLDEVRCNPFNLACVPQNQESCIGTISCKTANCGGFAAGSICIYSGVARNFMVCANTQ